MCLAFFFFFFFFFDSMSQGFVHVSVGGRWLFFFFSFCFFFLPPLEPPIIVSGFFFFFFFFAQQYVCGIHPCHCGQSLVVSFHYCVIFNCVTLTQRTYPFLWLRALEVISGLCCWEHSCACLGLNFSGKCFS